MKKTKGFTLVELLVVIAILAILATVSIVGYTQFIAKSKQSVVMQEAVQLRDVIIADDINNKNYHVDSTNGKVVGDTTDYIDREKIDSKEEVAESMDKVAVDEGDDVSKYYVISIAEQPDKTVGGKNYDLTEDEVAAKDYTDSDSIYYEYTEHQDAVTGQTAIDADANFVTLFKGLVELKGTITVEDGVVKYTKDGYTATLTFNGGELTITTATASN